MSGWLEGLRDVPGCVGGFIFAPDGRLIAAELPPFFKHAEVSLVAEKLATLLETIREVNTESTGITLHYADGRIDILPHPSQVIVTLAEPAVDERALRMVTRLVRRRLERASEGEASSRSGGSMMGPASWAREAAHGSDSDRSSSTYPSFSARHESPTSEERAIARTQPSVPSPELSERDTLPPPASAPKTMMYRGRRILVP